MMCWDGLTAAQAARIGLGLGLFVAAFVAVAILSVETWIAWFSGAEGEEPEPQQERETLKLEGAEQ